MKKPVLAWLLTHLTGHPHIPVTRARVCARERYKPNVVSDVSEGGAGVSCPTHSARTATVGDTATGRAWRSSGYGVAGSGSRSIGTGR
jgi:hypothetical protein